MCAKLHTLSQFVLQLLYSLRPNSPHYFEQERLSGSSLTVFEGTPKLFCSGITNMKLLTMVDVDPVSSLFHF